MKKQIMMMVAALAAQGWAASADYARSKWFSTSCCPVNVVRFMPQIPMRIYGVGDGGLYRNLLAASVAEVAVGGGLRLIPYFSWCNRGKHEMEVWFKE